MGYSATSHTVIGIQIEKNDLYEETETRGCKHPVSKSKFCPECGQPVWNKDSKPVAAYDDCREKLGGFDLVHVSCESDQYIIAGWQIEASSGNENPAFSKPPNFEAIKAKMKVVLEPLGFWEENKFGIYAVLYESY